jgi:hypothetical protein
MDRRPPLPRRPNRACSDHPIAGSDHPMTWTTRHSNHREVSK